MEFIIDPVTKQKFKLLSFEGRRVLKNLINSYMEGGSRTWDDEIKIASNKCNLRLRSIGERYPGLAEKLGDLKKWTNLGFGIIYEQACVFRHEDGTLMFEFLDEEYFINTTNNIWWKWNKTENNWNTTEPPRYSRACNLRLRSIRDRYPRLAEKLGDLKKWTNLGFGIIYEQACVFRHEDGTLMFEFLDLRASRRTRDAHPREQYFIYTTKNTWWKWDSTENNWNTTEPPRYSRAK